MSFEVPRKFCPGNLARTLGLGATAGLIWSLPIVSFGNAPAGQTAYFLISGILSGILVSLVLKNLVIKLRTGGVMVAGILSAPLAVFSFVFLASILPTVSSDPRDLPPNVLWCGSLAVCAVLGLVFCFIPAILIISGSLATAFLLRAVLLQRKTWPWITALIALFSASLMAAAWWHPHGISLSGSPEQTRASLLEISPLGTTLAAVKTRIHARLHPETFQYYEHADGLSGEHWPLGGEHHGKEIISQIGQDDLWDLGQNVVAYWVFDDHDRLADILVFKTPNAL